MPKKRKRKSLYFGRKRLFRIHLVRFLFSVSSFSHNICNWIVYEFKKKILIVVIWFAAVFATCRCWFVWLVLNLTWEIQQMDGQHCTLPVVITALMLSSMSLSPHNFHAFPSVRHHDNVLAIVIYNARVLSVVWLLEFVWISFQFISGVSLCICFGRFNS